MEIRGTGRYSRYGTHLAAGDVNDDDHEDILCGSGGRKAAVIYSPGTCPSPFIVDLATESPDLAVDGGVGYTGRGYGWR